MIRCAACGSRNVMVDHEQSQFSAKKAVIGTAAIGLAGAAAGFVGDKKAVYKCKDCGMELSYCMDEMTTLKIDMALETGLIDANWTAIKAKYPNIERGAIEANNDAFQQQITSGYETVAAKEFIQKYIQDMHALWTPEYTDMMEKRKKAEKQEIEQYNESTKRIDKEKGFKEKEKQILEDMKRCLKNRDAANDNKKKIYADIKSKEKELASLGLFSRGRKKELSVVITALKEEAIRAGDSYKKLCDDLKTYDAKNEQLENDRKAAYVQAGLPKECPTYSECKDCELIFKLYNNNGSLASWEKKVLAKEIFHRVVLFLAQNSLDVRTTCAIATQVCTELGIVGFKNDDLSFRRGYDVPELKVYIGGEYINLLRLPNIQKSAFPLFPGQEKCQFYDKEHPYYMADVSLSDGGRKYMNSSLLYNTLLNAHGGMSNFMYSYIISIEPTRPL